MNFKNGLIRNLESEIKQKAIFLKGSRREFDIAPEIPVKALEQWYKKYQKHFTDDIRNKILILSDTKTGSFALTGDALYYDNYLQGGMCKILYADMKSISYTHGSVVKADQVHIVLHSGKQVNLDACIDGINLSCLQELLTEAAEKARSQNLCCSIQNRTLVDLPEAAKTLYLKILCNKAYLDSKNIDATAYNSIGKFAVRMDASRKVRQELCRYMNEMDCREKTGKLLVEAAHLMEQDSGQWDCFRYSLVQDLLYLSMVMQNETFSWRNDGFLGSLLEACDLYPEQLDTMTKAVELNKKMQVKGADMKELLARWKKLKQDTRYTRGYVAGQYLFCSGSIYGLKEYTGFLCGDALDQKALNKQRELILHKIIENTQKTINLLIEDVNFMADRLEKATADSAEIRQRYLIILDRFRQGITRLQETEQSSRDELDNSKSGQVEEE